MKTETGRQITTEVEITPEMTKAGREAYHGCNSRFFDVDDLVETIFEAMVTAERCAYVRP